MGGTLGEESALRFGSMKWSLMLTFGFEGAMVYCPEVMQGCGLIAETVGRNEGGDRVGTVWRNRRSEEATTMFGARLSAVL
jgi:hypothetical protein